MELPDTIEEFLDSVSPKLRYFLRKEDAVVSGSTAVYYYMKKNDLNPQFEPSDIDMYTTVSKTVIEDAKLFPKKQLIEAEQCKYSHIKTINDVISYNIPHYNKKIDIIFISEDFKGKNSVDFINETFDLDICKCWYDGKELHGNYELLKGRKCILTRTNIDLTQTLPTEKILRYFSDIRRGEGDFDPYHHIARNKKYRERGFEIDTSQLEIPQELVERYIQFGLALLNIHRLKTVNVVVCYDEDLLLNQSHTVRNVSASTSEKMSEEC